MKTSLAFRSFVVLSIALAFTSVSAVAQNTAPVVDLSGANSAAVKVSKKPDATVGDSYYQSQVLQNEVRELRGMVEQLSYELQRVKQRQMDDYLDIDRRLSAVVSGVASTGQAGVATGQVSSTTPAEQTLSPTIPTNTQVFPATAQTFPVTTEAATAVSQANGQATAEKTIPVVQKPVINSKEIADNYAQASNLLLKERDLDGAVIAFKQHVIDYPASPYIANAYYWLGEIYLLQGQDELARQAFTLIVDQHPAHGKAMDANFKLGKIYHQLGENDRARRLLDTAAKGAGGAAIKAQNYIKNNF